MSLVGCSSRRLSEQGVPPIFSFGNTSQREVACRTDNESLAHDQSACNGSPGAGLPCAWLMAPGFQFEGGARVIEQLAAALEVPSLPARRAAARWSQQGVPGRPAVCILISHLKPAAGRAGVRSLSNRWMGQLGRSDKSHASMARQATHEQKAWDQTQDHVAAHVRSHWWIYPALAPLGSGLLTGVSSRSAPVSHPVRRQPVALRFTLTHVPHVTHERLGTGRARYNVRSHWCDCRRVAPGLGLAGLKLTAGPAYRWCSSAISN